MSKVASENSHSLKETFELSKFVEPFKVHFITILDETHTTDGQITLRDKNVTLYMHFDPKLFDFNQNSTRLMILI
jgi:hypothetical protein